jgi:hypothetical protein
MSTTSKVNENVGNSNVEALFLDAANAWEGLDSDNEPDVGVVAETVEADADANTFYGKPIGARSDNAIDVGEWSDEFLNREITFMTAPWKNWGAESKWLGRKLGKCGWLVERCTWRQFINTFDNPQVSEKKDGTMFVLAEMTAKDGAAGISRAKMNVRKIFGMPFDLDLGQPGDEIFPPLLASGSHFIYYPSHSNGKTRTEIEFKALSKFDPAILERIKSYRDGDTAALETLTDDVRRFLADKGFHTCIVESARVVKINNTFDYFADAATDKKQRENPACVVIDHAPIHKARIILLLDTPYVIPEGDGDDALEAERDWEALYHHIGTTLGFQFDKTGKDLNRAFYSARRKPNATYLAVFGGSKPLALPDCTEEMREAAGQKNREKRKAALAARAAKRGDKKLEGIPDTATFMRRNGESFDGIGWLKALHWKTRGEVRGGKVTIKCPNEEKLHTKTDGPDMGCAAINPNSGYGPKFQIKCLHDHCEHLYTEDFLTMICEEVIESTVEGDLPALENFVTESDFESAAATEKVTDSKSEKKPTYAKLKKLLKGSSYAVNDFGSVEFDEKDGDKVKTHIICQAFEPHDLVRDETDSHWYLRISFVNRDGKERQTNIPLYELKKRQSDLSARLYGDDGMKIWAGQYLNGLLAHVADMIKERAISIRKTGWRPDRKAFVFPDGTVMGEIGGEGVWLKNAYRDQQGGTLGDQLKAWGIALRHGGPHHFIGCVGSCAGTVVQYVRLGSTPNVGLIGSSGFGKSVSMKIAAGGWGWPQLLKEDKSRGGLNHSFSSTKNQMEIPAMRSTGMVFCVDETAHLTPKQIATELEPFIFMLHEGKGKSRAGYGREGMEAREDFTWSTFGIIAAENPLSKDIEAHGRTPRVGFSARIAEINISDYKKMPQDLFNELNSLVDSNFGHIGPKFVAHMLARGASPEDLRKEIDKKVALLTADIGAERGGRAATVFAVLWVTGELLWEAELLPEWCGPEEVEARIRKLWDGYYQSEVAVLLDPAAKAIQTLRKALVTRRDVDVYPNTYKVDRTKNRAAVAYYVPRFDESAFASDSGEPQTLPPLEFFVLKDELHRLAGGIVDAGVIVAKLEEMGILKRPEGKKKKKTVFHQYVPKVGYVDAYLLDWAEEGEGGE